MEGSSHNLLFGDAEEDYGESCVRYPGSVSRRGVRFWYPTVADTEPFAIAVGPSLGSTVGIGSVPGHRRYCRGKQKVSRDCGFLQALPCLHFGKGRLE